MNKTAVFITFAVLCALGLIGTMVLLINRPDATATFTTFVVNILGLASIAAGTFYGLGKTNEKLDRVEKQTNGTLSRRDNENKRLADALIRLAMAQTGPVKNQEKEDNNGR